MRYSPSMECFYPEWGNYAELPSDLIIVTDVEADIAIKRPKGMDIIVVNGKITIQPTPQISLAEKKSVMWGKIKTERDKRKDGGFKVNGWWFHSDQPSRVQHLGLVMLGAALPNGILWKTMSGEFVPLSQIIVSQIFASGLQLDTALFAQAEIHRVAMEASSNPEAYNYKTGWPENFLGL